MSGRTTKTERLQRPEHRSDAPDRALAASGVCDWRALKHKRKRQTNRTLEIKKPCPTPS
ncbi:MAG: hypothetical protein KAJ93_08715 [Methanosarcinales archaeon]|nr:hypothetical protein [Methanosarcinales archaeon]